MARWKWSVWGRGSLPQKNGKGECFCGGIEIVTNRCDEFSMRRIFLRRIFRDEFFGDVFSCDETSAIQLDMANVVSLNRKSCMTSRKALLNLFKFGLFRFFTIPYVICWLILIFGLLQTTIMLSLFRKSYTVEPTMTATIYVYSRYVSIMALFPLT